MFEMCNWKSGPTSVAINWATKSVMHYRDPLRGSWYTDEVEPSSEFTTEFAPLATSTLLATLLSSMALVKVRFLRSVTGNGVVVAIQDWAIIRQLGEATYAGCVTEMMECVCVGDAFSCIRLRSTLHTVFSVHRTPFRYLASRPTPNTRVFRASPHLETPTPCPIRRFLYHYLRCSNELHTEVPKHLRRTL